MHLHEGGAPHGERRHHGSGRGRRVGRRANLLASEMQGPQQHSWRCRERLLADAQNGRGRGEGARWPHWSRHAAWTQQLTPPQQPAGSAGDGVWGQGVGAHGRVPPAVWVRTAESAQLIPALSCSVNPKGSGDTEKSREGSRFSLRTKKQIRTPPCRQIRISSPDHSNGPVQMPVIYSVNFSRICASTADPMPRAQPLFPSEVPPKLVALYSSPQLVIPAGSPGQSAYLLLYPASFGSSCPSHPGTRNVPTQVGTYS